MKRICTKTLLLLLCAVLPAFLVAQKNTYSGKIMDGDLNEALIGVNIIVKNTAQGTVSDFEGMYQIQAATGDTLVFSYLGYQTYQLALNNQLINNVTLMPDLKVLDEVVVIGYGTVKKSDLTGSVASVKAEDIVKVPAANPLQALQGKVSGLQVMSVSGDPGAPPVLRLRGITTFTNNDPLVVIDGVISNIGTASLLNANDIESIEVLKDASSIAIFGSRGAAGVILISTKKGQPGKNVVYASIERSIENVANKIDVMSGREFATYLNEITPGTYNNLDALPNVDWQDLIFQENAPITNANLSVSGGSDKANYYFSLGFLDQEGILPKSDIQRFNAKLNTVFKLSDHLDLGVDLSASIDDKNNAPGVINTALWAWPINEPYLADGVTFAEVNGGNPLAAIEYTNSNTRRLRSLGNLYGAVHFLKGFTFKSSIQYELNDGKTRNFVPKYFVAPLQQNEVNDLSYGGNTYTSFIFENTLSYNKKFGKHGINSLVGYTAQDERNQGLFGSTEALLREDELFWYLDAGQEEFDRVSGGYSRNTLLSVLGRVNYSYDSRYLFTASFRRDGSSKFGSNNRYGNFPSFALGWNVSNESFFPNATIFNTVKFRFSWGKVGNENIPQLGQYSIITQGVNAVFGEDESVVAGASFVGGGNPNLKWEDTAQTNFGINLALWENKLVGEFDYYIKKTDDILVRLTPIGYTGIGAFETIFFNAANIENKGFEWNVSYRDKIGDFSYGVGVLGTTINNEVVDIGEDFGADSLVIGGDLGNGQQIARSAVGFPVGFYYGYEVEGVFQNQAELESSATLFDQVVGDLKYKDINQDGVINGKDRDYIGSSIPDLVYGFNVNIGYKNITLSADFQGQQGGKIYNGKQAIRFTTLNYEDKYNNYWSGEGSTNETPKPSLGGSNFAPSSFFLEDASFLRLRTLTLNYDMPTSLLSKLRISKTSVYIRATNLFTATSYTGYSPEIGASSAIDGVIDRGIYPITKVFTLGLNSTF